MRSDKHTLQEAQLITGRFSASGSSDCVKLTNYKAAGQNFDRYICNLQIAWPGARLALPVQKFETYKVSTFN